MKKEYSIEMFLEECGDTLSEYLSHVSTKKYDTDRCRKLNEKINRILAEYPDIAAIIDMDRPKNLTQDECAVLIELLHARAMIDEIGEREVYFQGCLDCIKYLKMLKLL